MLIYESHRNVSVCGYCRCLPKSAINHLPTIEYQLNKTMHIFDEVTLIGRINLINVISQILALAIA